MDNIEISFLFLSLEFKFDDIFFHLFRWYTQHTIEFWLLDESNNGFFSFINYNLCSIIICSQIKNCSISLIRKQNKRFQLTLCHFLISFHYFLYTYTVKSHLSKIESLNKVISTTRLYSKGKCLVLEKKRKEKTIKKYVQLITLHTKINFISLKLLFLFK